MIRYYFARFIVVVAIIRQVPRSCFTMNMGNGIEFNWWKWLISIGLLHKVACSCENKRPNIVFIMVDDMGWNDVSYHGSDQILTPNIDALASRSVVLQQYYSEAICTPARTALLTGKYPSRLGMQGRPLTNAEDRGIPLTERLLPAYLKDLGFSTHLVGKWHVGMSRRQFLPRSRGYDTHYGFRGGFVDYYTHDKVEEYPDGRQFFGLDLYNDDVPQDEEKRYAVDALTDRAISIIQNHNESRPLFLHLTHNCPHAGNEGALLQPPLYSSTKNDHIANSNRRLYAEMVRHLDDSVGRVVSALADKGILQNTIITFMSDNGAPTVGEFRNWGVNLPFRGKKQTPWEGAVRVPAFVWHASLQPKVWTGLMHITDWMPTLIAAVGGEIRSDIDGINQWESLITDGKSRRKDVLISYDDGIGSNNVYASYRLGDYKIVVGNVSGMSNGYYGANYLANKGPVPDYYPAVRSSQVAKALETLGIYLDYDEVIKMRKASTVKQLDKVRDLIPCEPSPTRGCLYNVVRDPSESHDLWPQGTRVANLLTSRLQALWASQVPRAPPRIDDRANPANFGFRWVPWLNDSVTDIQNNTAINQNGRDCPFLTTSTNSAASDTTIASAIGCDNTTTIANFLCILRSVF